MKHYYIHTAYCQFVFCLAITNFLESLSNIKYLQGDASTFPHSLGVLQYLTTLTSTQHMPARTAIGNMLDDGTCMMSRPADGSNVQEITRGRSTMSKPIASSLPPHVKIIITNNMKTAIVVSRLTTMTYTDARKLHFIKWQISELNTQQPLNMDLRNTQVPI
jgi:hypothetical protein